MNIVLVLRRWKIAWDPKQDFDWRTRYDIIRDTIYVFTSISARDADNKI